MTYNPDRISLVFTNGTPCSLSNICHGNGHNKYATVIDLRDTVEDSRNAKELHANIAKLNLVGWYNITIDRDTPEYTRLKGSDTIGNIHYLKVEKLN